MLTRLPKRIVHFANLPIKLCLPTITDNISEIALKTIPSASKIEIKRVLESLYGFEVAEVRTLNRDGKKKKRGGALYARPDYKKAYVTLRRPLSISPDLYPYKLITEARAQRIANQRGTTVVHGGSADSDPRERHWLHGREVRASGPMRRPDSAGFSSHFFRREPGAPKTPWKVSKNQWSVTKTMWNKPIPKAPSPPPSSPRDEAKFPWSSMKSYGSDSGSRTRTRSRSR